MAANSDIMSTQTARFIAGRSFHGSCCRRLECRKKRAGSEGELSPGLHSLSGGVRGEARAVVVEDYIIHNGFDCTVSDISTEKPGNFVPASVGHNPK